MLKFLHHLIRVQLQTPTSTGAVEEESGGVPRRNKTPAMSQAVGTLLVVLWLVCVVGVCGWMDVLWLWLVGTHRVFLFVLGWTTILLDAHFQSIVMEGRHEDSKMNSVLTSLSTDIQDLIATCRTFTKIKAQVNHLSKSNISLNAPVPDYSIERLTSFKWMLCTAVTGSGEREGPILCVLRVVWRVTHILDVNVPSWTKSASERIGVQEGTNKNAIRDTF
jgi:hypothetical protein